MSCFRTSIEGWRSLGLADRARSAMRHSAGGSVRSGHASGGAHTAPHLANARSALDQFDRGQIRQAILAALRRIDANQTELRSVVRRALRNRGEP